LRFGIFALKIEFMGFYPDKINRLFAARVRAGKAARTNSVGTGASFVCGSFVRFYLEIDVPGKEIRDARYKTNGCGFAVAAAETLTGKIVGRRLTELHGLNPSEFFSELESELGAFPAGRRHCAALCLDALQAALQDFRALQIEEFAGEKVLICTCFGVSEETIQAIIAENEAETVEEIGALCHAGTGCGSCRFLIQELIDVHEIEK
jgi:NifU-like protein involved in Fe-S cluster formation/bacterioferritin-associated ferredoxin